MLGSVLLDVSRSFHQTLRILPARIRPQISLAYLLARTSDTVADTDLVPLEQRLRALHAFRDRIMGREGSLNFGDFAARQGAPAERILLENGELSLSLLTRLSEPDLQLVREVLAIIISGQELDLRRFAGASANRIIALQTDEELEDYTYRVAGSVGEFWTRVCHAHLFPTDKIDLNKLMNDGVRFGKGLQLVNILRDVPADLRNGRCYLPEGSLQAAGLVPTDLLDPANYGRLRPLVDRYLDLASRHLSAGWEYTNALPRHCVRVRLACAWPILIGVETLQLLRANNVLDHERRYKVSRRRVKQLMFRSVVLYPFSGAWRRLVEAQGTARSPSGPRE